MSDGTDATGERGLGPATSHRESAAGIVPANYRGWVAFGFHKWVVRPMFRRRFHAVRVLREGAGVLAGLREHAGPVIGLANHPSWWDPLLMFLVHERAFGLPKRGDRDHAGRAARGLLAPIDRKMLEQFGFMTRLGVFGVEPHRPESTEAVTAYMLRQFHELTRPTLWATPEGRFTDVRERAKLRPGAAAIAAGWSQDVGTRSGEGGRPDRGVRVVCAAVEYGFWTDQKPEVFLSFAEAPRPQDPGKTTDWLRSMREAFAANQDRLGEAVISRDPGRFEVVLGGDAERASAEVHPVYGLWLRMRGKSGRLTDRYRAERAAEQRGEA